MLHIVYLDYLVQINCYLCIVLRTFMKTTHIKVNWKT